MPGKMAALVAVTSAMRFDRYDQTEATSDRFEQIGVLGHECDHRLFPPQVAIRRDQSDHVGDVGRPPRKCRSEAMTRPDPTYTRSTWPNGNLEPPRVSPDCRATASEVRRDLICRTELFDIHPSECCRADQDARSVHSRAFAVRSRARQCAPVLTGRDPSVGLRRRPRPPSPPSEPPYSPRVNPHDVWAHPIGDLLDDPPGVTYTWAPDPVPASGGVDRRL